jgi:dTDP-4-dehydrorhamnose 3,5-epimerase
VIVRETELRGVFDVIDEPTSDERGSFARIWSGDELRRAGIEHDCAQLSISRSARAGTIRGLHLAAAPHEEAKLVRCVRGSIFDVAVDVRPGSPTFGAFVARELSSASGRALFIPRGFAHGLQTLEDDTDVLYAIDTPFVASAARAIRYDDPTIGVRWPLPPTVVSERDANAPTLDEFVEREPR